MFSVTCRKTTPVTPQEKDRRWQSYNLLQLTVTIEPLLVSVDRTVVLMGITIVIVVLPRITKSNYIVSFKNTNQ